MFKIMQFLLMQIKLEYAKKIRIPISFYILKKKILWNFIGKKTTIGDNIFYINNYAKFMIPCGLFRTYDRNSNMILMISSDWYRRLQSSTKETTMTLFWLNLFNDICIYNSHRFDSIPVIRTGRFPICENDLVVISKCLIKYPTVDKYSFIKLAVEHNLSLLSKEMIYLSSSQIKYITKNFRDDITSITEKIFIKKQEMIDAITN